MKQNIIAKIELVKSKLNLTYSVEELFNDLMQSKGITFCELCNTYSLTEEEIEYIY